MDLSKYIAVWLVRLTLTVTAKWQRLYASKPPTNTGVLHVTCFKFYVMMAWWSNDWNLLPVSWIIKYRCVRLQTYILIIIIVFLNSITQWDVLKKINFSIPLFTPQPLSCVSPGHWSKDPTNWMLIWRPQSILWCNMLHVWKLPVAVRKFSQSKHLECPSSNYSICTEVIFSFVTLNKQLRN
jgi:hypothetical protein